MFMPSLCAFLRAARERQCIGRFETAAQLAVDRFGRYTRAPQHACNAKFFKLVYANC